MLNGEKDLKLTGEPRFGHFTNDLVSNGCFVRAIRWSYVSCSADMMRSDGVSAVQYGVILMLSRPCDVEYR